MGWPFSFLGGLYVSGLFVFGEVVDYFSPYAPPYVIQERVEVSLGYGSLGQLVEKLVEESVSLYVRGGDRLDVIKWVPFFALIAVTLHDGSYVQGLDVSG